MGSAAPVSLPRSGEWPMSKPAEKLLPFARSTMTEVEASVSARAKAAMIWSFMTELMALSLSARSSVMTLTLSSHSYRTIVACMSDIAHPSKS